jgi:hypothetical protein
MYHKTARDFNVDFLGKGPVSHICCSSTAIQSCGIEIFGGFSAELAFYPRITDSFLLLMGPT